MVSRPTLHSVFYKRILACFMVGLILPQANSALAAINKSDTWYQIEVIVANRIDHTIDSEAFPSMPDIISFDNARVLTELDPTGNSLQLDSEEFVSLPINQRILNNEADTLTTNDSYDVLFHQSWRQILTGNKVINWIDIRAGYAWGGHQQLEGRLGFSKGRYLHVHSDIHLNQFPKTQNATSQRSTSYLFSLDSPLAPDIETRYSLVQRRKMRSNELHYLDHPKLVLLVKIIPYTPSEPILEEDTVLDTAPVLKTAPILETDSSLETTLKNEPALVDLTVPSTLD